MSWRNRNHPAYWAFLLHRISGIALALFLPLHFWALSQAIQGEAALDGFLRWTEQPLVKLAEILLVVLLAAHFTGGIRLLMIEWLPWRDWQKTVMGLSAGVTLLFGLLFLLNLV